MKRALIRLPLALKAARELGLPQVFWYSVYQLGLRTGHYRRATPVGEYPALPYTVQPLFALPDRSQLQAVTGELAVGLIEEADEIAAGQVRLFGGPAVPLALVPPDAARHWTYYEGRPASWGVDDIKLIWEPARFGWVYPMGRAYAHTGDEKYPAAFWQHFETFLKANPPNRGPNWSSAQEAAIRLLALLFAAGFFRKSIFSTPERMARLSGAVAAHARRIPPTLPYALAQNNNHLVSEALGVYAAGCALPDHPEARRWQKTGWRWLNKALQSQIAPNGTYVQHSMNYHRLMLHAALQATLPGRPFPPQTRRRLASATRWLLAQVDPNSGRAPNLGSNDGANILPLAAGGFGDYRPVAQAAARAFLDHPAYERGPWDELGLWLGQSIEPSSRLYALPKSKTPYRLSDENSWATLRAVQFNSRPSHADQLHVDLWWNGENVALDAGTFRYTAPAPWDNTLAQTLVHNTIEVNGQNQMQRAGRFLWLDWAQAVLLSTGSLQAEAVAAQHDGYLHLGVLHRRVLKRIGSTEWQVIDYLLRGRTLRLDVPRSPIYSYRLHWLLPDWPWELEDSRLTLRNPSGGTLRLEVISDPVTQPLARPASISLVRAGKALVGPEMVSPILGWYSPTYNTKIAALSLAVVFRSALPLTLISRWAFEE